MRLFEIFTALTALLAVALPAAAFEVYQSPGDDGLNPGTPGNVPIGGSRVLFLYADHGSGTASAAGDACSGAGTGDEMCLIALHLVVGPNLAIVSFTPDQAFDALAETTASETRFNGGDPLLGELGPTRMGALEVSASGPGDLTVSAGLWVDSLLDENALVPGAVIASACDDTDGDGLCDIEDPCASYANVDFTDANGDGIPNECQCGDTNADGFVASTDAFNMTNCLQDPECPAGPVDVTIWDTNNDGFVASTDAFNAITAFQNSTEYQLTCARRPEGTLPP